MNSHRSRAGQTGRINPLVGLAAAAAAVVAILAVTSSPTGRSTLAEAVPATQAAPSAAERPAYFPDGFPPIEGEIQPHIEAF
jgi:hypothetical protein